MDTFTQAVQAERSRPFIDLLCVRPMGVTTKMVDNISNSFGGIFVSPQACVRGFLRDLGHDKVTFGATSHQIIGNLGENVPLFLLQGCLNWFIAKFIERRRKHE